MNSERGQTKCTLEKKPGEVMAVNKKLLGVEDWKGQSSFSTAEDNLMSQHLSPAKLDTMEQAVLDTSTRTSHLNSFWSSSVRGIFLCFSQCCDKMTNRRNLWMDVFGLCFKRAYSPLQQEDMVWELKAADYTTPSNAADYTSQWPHCAVKGSWLYCAVTTQCSQRQLTM